jgi:acyl-CoA reductase-like NAD-dependent aldehyde dehydrogenase
MIQSDNFNEIIEHKRAFVTNGNTKTCEFRIRQLKTLKKMILEHETDIEKALYLDLHKPSFEAQFSEIQIVVQEINHLLKNLSLWMEDERVETPLLHLPGESFIMKQPFGIVLIIAPWNYPFQLLMAPLAGAIAAGNAVVLKPSEISSNTSSLMAELIAGYFNRDYIQVIEGGIQETGDLLKCRFDYIFYTGSTAVGKIVMEAAAKHITPLTLELGGKSPCIIDKNIHIRKTAEKICWGKFFNAGQTCIAPDYLLVHKDVKETLLAEIKKTIQKFYGNEISKSRDYARIVSEKHYKRLILLMDKEKIYCGGSCSEEEKYIEPTVMNNVSWYDKVMEDEIFGPLLPVLDYESLDEVIHEINVRPKPLAMYIFSGSEKFSNSIISATSAGGVCINDTLSHITTVFLPFGGVGDSGMGAYHGRASFDTFTHRKPVMRKAHSSNISLRYPPYRSVKPWLKKIINWLG